MVSKETFVKICKWYEEVDERCSKQDKALEEVFNRSFHNEEGYFDNSLMFCWPLEAAQELMMIIVKELGESDEGAEWFVFEGFGQITSGLGTKIDNYEINTVEDYYNYITR